MNLIHFDLLLAITKSTFVVRTRGLGTGGATNIPHMTVVMKEKKKSDPYVSDTAIGNRRASCNVTDLHTC